MLSVVRANDYEEAVRLKEGAAGADSLITALCMGPEGALRMKQLANATQFGLGSGVLTRDVSKAHRAVREET